MRAICVDAMGQSGVASLEWNDSAEARACSRAVLLVLAILTQALPTLYEPAPPPACLERRRRFFLHVPVEDGNRMRLETQNRKE